MTMTTRRELITPAVAAKMLETNTHNRNITPRLVNQYARDMSTGAWREHHQGIAFDESGVLCDGQHRLLAVIESKCSVWMLVTRGVQSAAMEGIDIGKGRTTADIFTLDGIPCAGRVVPIATLMEMVMKRTEWRNVATFPSKSEIRAAYDKYKIALDWAAGGHNAGFHSQLKSAAPGCALALFYLKHPAIADEFRNLLTTPVNQGADSPVLALRTLLDRWPRNQNTRKKDLAEHVLSGSFSFLRGRKVTVIRPIAEATRYFTEGVGELL